MKKQLKYIIISIAVVSSLIISSIIISASDKNPFTVIGTLSKSFFNKGEEQGPIVAKINGLPIFESEIFLLKQSYEAAGKEVTIENLVKKTAIDLLLLEEAATHNINVTIEKAEEQARFEIGMLKKTMQR